MSMGTAGGSSNGRSAPATLAEINVTPMVDVMLVLLVIFMITSSAQSFEMEQQARRLSAEQAAIEPGEQDQLVEIDLPRTTSKAVNLSEAKRIVLSFTRDYAFYMGPTKVLACADTVERWPARLPARDTGDLLFARCIPPLIEKLLANEKLKADQELYLRADRALPYGRVLKLMAEVRRAGIHKFGLVAEDDE